MKYENITYTELIYF